MTNSPVTSVKRRTPASASAKKRLTTTTTITTGATTDTNTKTPSIKPARHSNLHLYLFFSTLLLAAIASLFYSFTHLQSTERSFYEPAYRLLWRQSIPPLSASPVSRELSWWRKTFTNQQQAFNDSAAINQTEVVFIGDGVLELLPSEIYYTLFLSTYKMMNLGLREDRTHHTLYRLKHLPLHKLAAVKLLVVAVGSENAADLQSVEQIVSGLQAVLDELNRQLPDTKVMLLELLPRGDGYVKDVESHRVTPFELIQRVNQRLHTLQHSYLNILPLTDLFVSQDDIEKAIELNNRGEDVLLSHLYLGDRVHLKRRGYDLLASRLAQQIYKLIHGKEPEVKESRAPKS